MTRYERAACDLCDWRGSWARHPVWHQAVNHQQQAHRQYVAELGIGWAGIDQADLSPWIEWKNVPRP